MLKTFFKFLLTGICLFLIQFHLAYSQAVYVDSQSGNDNNSGAKNAPLCSVQKAMEIIQSRDNEIHTMKINPGIYILEHPVSVATSKSLADKRLVIEASILPGDSLWQPEKMPVLVSQSPKGEISDYYHFVAGFLINESHVTIRGLKFPGYFYPNARYFPIARLNKAGTDLLVEQCMFIGDDDVSHLQVGVIAHGNEVKIDHCIFYGARNSVVFWQDSGGGAKTGNSLTNSIIYGASQSAVWTAWSDKDFLFENNIVSNCKHFWIKNADNPTRYALKNCVVVNNEHYQALAGDTVTPQAFEIDEVNIIKEGKILLRKKPDNVDNPLAVDYLHVIPNSLGDEIDAGLFKNNDKR